jgi:hypothetical protein
MSVSQSIESLILSEALATFRSQKDLAERAIVQVSDADLHRSLDPQTNSIVVIMKHLAGNMKSRWSDFLTSDGEKPWRDRDGEFVDDFTSRDQLMQFWNAGWAVLFDTLEALTPQDLTRIVTIRGEPHTVIKAITRQLSHYGYHVGQIVMIARIHAGERWSTLTIPRGRGESQKFNNRTWQKT